MRMPKFLRKLFPIKKRLRSLFSGASTGRLYSSWTTRNVSSDAELSADLETLRARSRELMKNNDYARKFQKLCVTNIVGPQGIHTQSKIKDPDGTFDRPANQIIEGAFKQWMKPKNASVTGQSSWIDLQRTVVQTVARDGEILIRKVRQRGFNDFSYSLQLLEADYLDHHYDAKLSNGNTVRMGVELNEWRRPVAYWLLQGNPADSGIVSAVTPTQRIRVPADDIIHIFLRERPEQTRGIPWLVSAMTRLNQIGAYEEAELVASRAGASKMGFYVSEDGAAYTGDEKEGGTNDVLENFEPGTMQQLPAGIKVETFDPNHPSGNFDPFYQAVLRGIAAGIGITYHSLSGDLRGVNYSSIRAGTLEERDFWRILQNWIVEHLCTPVFESWLEMALMTRLRLPMAKFEKFNQPKFNVRGWTWVDPLKDVQASALAVANGFRTRHMIVSEYGEDFEEILETLAQEQEMMDELGVATTPAANITATISETVEATE